MYKKQETFFYALFPKNSGKKEKRPLLKVFFSFLKNCATCTFFPYNQLTNQPVTTRPKLFYLGPTFLTFNKHLIFNPFYNKMKSWK